MSSMHLPSNRAELVRQLSTDGWVTFDPPAELAALGAQALSAVLQVFALPAERKLVSNHPEWHELVGWSQPSRPNWPDEIWQLRSSVWPEDWPAELQSERACLTVLGKRCEQIGRAVLAGLDVRMAGPATGKLASNVNPEQTVVRLLHYRPRTTDLSFRSHTDPGLITVFAGESCPGLQLRNGAGDWQTPGPRWVIAAGEMLAASTVGQVRPAEHQVMSRGTERWAIAVFLHPDPDCVVCLDDKGLPITAREFFERAKPSYD